MKTTAWLSAMIFATFLLALAQGAAATPQVAQASTPIPMLTGTAIGPYILVPDQVNVRMCPSTDCDLVGVLIAGQQAPAIGRSSGGDWIQIIYQGVPGNIAWVYSPFVVLEAGPSLLPIIEPPPTPTPRITATIDPTLAAQFNLTAPTATPSYLPDVRTRGEWQWIRVSTDNCHYYTYGRRYVWVGDISLARQWHTPVGFEYNLGMLVCVKNSAASSPAASCGMFWIIPIIKKKQVQYLRPAL